MTAMIEKPAREKAPAHPGAVPTGKRTGRAYVCGYHQFGNSGHCPGAVRNGRLGVLPCTQYEGPERCLGCKTEDPENLVDGQWRCANPLECEGRIRVKQERNATHQQLESIRTAMARDANALARHERQRNTVMARVRDAVARGEMGEDEADLLADSFEVPMDRKPGPAKTGSCRCCGEETRGGRFLPGHDAILKSRLKKAIRNGSEEEAQEAKKRMTEEGWNL